MSRPESTSACPSSGVGPRQISTPESLARIGLGLFCTGVLVLTMTPLLIILLPFRSARVRVTNVFGVWIGRSVMACAGCPVTVEGRENLSADRPAIYACNHTSTLDAFTTIWLTPMGTVGVAKKEVLYYPFYGQAWWLAGHIFLDRGQSARAKASLTRAAKVIKRLGLHVCILPEGTRSRDGRLLPFKKGIVHLALETRLPIVPMVTIGAQGTWDRDGLRLRPSPIRIVFLPPISTEAWTQEGMSEQIDAIRRPFLETLPAGQQPQPSS